jgi:signal transduction histidine kinase
VSSISIFQLILALGVAGAYFTIAVAIVPRIQLEDASARFVLIFRIAAIAFFIGCGLTHLHIAEYAVTNPDGVHWHEVIFHLLQVGGGWAFIILGWKSLDIKLVPRKTAEQLEAERLGALNTELTRSNEELEKFAYVVSHDLREPLRSIAGFAQLIERRYAGSLDEKADTYIDHMVGAAGRMETLLDGLLGYSRVSGAELVLAPVDCEQLLVETARSLSAAISESGAELTSSGLPTVAGDHMQLAQLFQNLIENAIKFVPEGTSPRIHVSAEQQNGTWLFTFRDNGIGIDPDHAERVFGMFARLNARDEYPGTGAGLAICERIVERHGGRIWVEPVPGGGTEFRFTIAAMPVAAAGDGQVPVTEAAR